MSVQLVIERYTLDQPVSEAARAEVRRLQADPGIDAPGLRDRRHLPFVTIDNADSRDLDQALYVARCAEGWTVWYALADAAHFVPAGSALFADALARGASFYLPDRALPMLPRALSEGLVSLNPREQRRALLMCMDVDRQGEVRSTRFERAVVLSRAKLSYIGVQRFLDGDDADPSLAADPVAASLRALAEVGQARLRRAAERDIVRYRRSEVEVKLARGAARFTVVSRPRLAVEQYNEQISLMCNVAGAEALLAARGDSHVHPIFRIHPDPGAKRYAEFSATLAGLCESQDLDPELWAWRRGDGRSLAEFLAALPGDGRAGRIALAIHRQALLMNYRSSFSAEPGGHHGVGAPVYGRFSAPMREVVGVFTHKELWEHLGELLPGAGDAVLRDQVVEAAHRARRIQSELSAAANLAVLDQLLGDDLRDGRERLGTVVGVTRAKLHVQLDDPAIDVKVYLRHLGEAVTLDATETAVSLGARGCVALGDAVALRVLGTEPGDRGPRWRFALRRRGP